MQSRYDLPGWYGIGSAFHDSLVTKAASIDLFRKMYAEWPFFNALIKNSQISLLKADMEIASLYAELVPDREISRNIFTRISEEHALSRIAVLQITENSDLLSDALTIRNSIQRRNPYVDPLNFIQIETLRRLRALPAQDSAEAGRLVEILFLTVNGIAAGLRNTG